MELPIYDNIRQKEAILLSKPLGTALTSDEKLQIVHRLWGSFKLLQTLWSVSSQDTSDWNAYFEFFNEEILQFTRSGCRSASMETYQGLFSVTDLIRRTRSKEEAREVLSSSTSNTTTGQTNHHRKNQDIESVIYLAVRLLTMTGFCSSFQGIRSGPHAFLNWEEGTLRDCLQKRFASQSTIQSSNSQLSFGRDFIARNLFLLGNIQIRWTDNLAYHLRLADDESEIQIFHHGTFLKWQSRIGTMSSFPVGFIDETLSTLALLFPQNHSATEKWLRYVERHENKKLDPQLSCCGQLRPHKRNLCNFKFWHDRLVILHESFENSDPGTLEGLWLDRRDRKQWFNSWIAIIGFVLTVFFGMVQGITGILQAYKAYHPDSGAGELR